MIDDTLAQRPRSPPLYFLYLIYLLYFHILTHSSALFCTLKNLNPILFNPFHTLRQKTQLPGVHPSGLKDQNETTNS